MLEGHLRVIASRPAAGRGTAERGPACSRSAPDLAAVRMLAECGELAAAFRGLAGADGGTQPASPAGRLARVIARERAGAGVPEA